MFFGALALSTVTYVGCKDYDDAVSYTHLDVYKRQDKYREDGM